MKHLLEPLISFLIYQILLVFVWLHVFAHLSDLLIYVLFQRLVLWLKFFALLEKGIGVVFGAVEPLIEFRMLENGETEVV